MVGDSGPDICECDFADMPEDALSSIYALLPAYSLRAAAATNSAWCRALRQAPQHIRRRASWMHHWTVASTGASIWCADSAVCTGDGTWSPGGVALATTLQLSRAQTSGFRLVVEDAAPGDLLMGITLLHPEAATPVASSSGGSGATGVAAVDNDVATSSLLEMGYNFIMGRGLDANGDIQMSPGHGGVLAPRSIFYGGRSRRCVFANPSATNIGPSIDMGPDGSSPGMLAKLRHVGDFVEFSLVDGQLRATDHTGHTHTWGVELEAGEFWVPTMAWTGSRASIRLAPPELEPFSSST
jgi:hypothetical protein